MIDTGKLCTLLALLCLLSVTSQAQPIWLVDVDGAIGPATADHMVRGLEQAQASGAELVILRIDTPGGLDGAMRDMIKAILASTVPVVSYVSPRGARAASAGTYILYASHIAAMAPATNLGAATPVQIGAPTLPTAPDPAAAPDDKATSAMENKIINDAVAYIEGLAQLRGRNAQWAIKAVREGASLPADQALALGVIDIVARDMQALLAQLDGRSVAVDGHSVVLHTSDSTVYYHPIDWRSEFLSVITNPNVAYLLMMAGIYGLLLEFYNPGMAIPGVLGGICLLLALYALQVLPVSYAGLGLIALGICLMTAEAFVPSFGILGLGGIVAFVFGSIMLMDTELPAYQVALPIIIAVATFSGALLVFGLAVLMKARKQVLVTGLQHLVGATAIVESVHNNTTMVRLDGELWQVNSTEPLQLRDKVSITAADGVVLDVKKT